MTDYAHQVAALLHGTPAAVASLHVTARTPFWDETSLPYELHGGGTLVRIVPRAGFMRDALVADAEEAAFVRDAEGGGWLVPADFVAEWMARHVRNAVLDDLLASHPAYAPLLRQDPQGHTLLGRSPLARWVPGVPTVAALRGPGPRPAGGAEAYADAVADLVGKLDDAFGLVGLDVTLELPSAGRRRRRGGRPDRPL